MRTLVGWVGTGAALVVVWAFALGLGFGVPKPPAITTEDVPRVSWKPLIRDLDLTVRGMASRSIVGWMPDGNGLLVQASHRVVDSRLHVVSHPGAKPRLLQHVPRNAGTVATEPGRGYVIFGWDEDGTEQFQLYRWDLGNSVPVLLTDGSERALFGAFEPRGRRFAFASNRRATADMDIYVADARRPGSERMVFQGTGTWAALDWSPAGDVLLLGRILSNVQNELYLLDLKSGEAKPVSASGSEPASHSAVRFTHDGSALYLVSNRGTEFKHVRRLDLATGTEAVLTDEIPWDVESVQESSDGSFLLLGVNEDGRHRTYVYDVGSDVPRPLDLFPDGLVGAALHPERPELLVNHTDGFGVSRGYTYDLETRELTLWTGTRPRTGSVESGRVVRYPTFDEVDGAPRLIPAFMYPGTGDGPRPVLIDIHGGPEAQARLSTRHVATQRAGITVIAPNVRGSTGYGKTFSKLDDGMLREDAVRDIGSLLDWIETRPDLDASRVAVTGGSYGGYMVLASLVHFRDRIKCGVDVVGVSNFVTFLENTAPYRRDLRRAEYGDERDPEMRAFLESISPLNHAERIVSPLMVVQGANDPRVPVTESRQMVERVRRNRQAVPYIEAADEGHGFRKPWNMLYARTAQTQMLESCLDGS